MNTFLLFFSLTSLFLPRSALKADSAPASFSSTQPNGKIMKRVSFRLHKPDCIRAEDRVRGTLREINGSLSFVSFCLRHAKGRRFYTPPPPKRNRFNEKPPNAARVSSETNRSDDEWAKRVRRGLVKYLCASKGPALPSSALLALSRCSIILERTNTLDSETRNLWLKRQLETILIMCHKSWFIIPAPSLIGRIIGVCSAPRLCYYANITPPLRSMCSCNMQAKLVRNKPRRCWEAFVKVCVCVCSVHAVMHDVTDEVILY